MEKSYSRIMAGFATALKYEDIPQEVVDKVKEHILDTMGCLLAGSATDWIGKINTVAKRLGGNHEATLVGDGARVGVANAVMANGTLGRSLDLDDTHFRPWEHISAYIVPQAMTVGEWLGKSGKDVITAAIAGYEVSCRVGLARFRDKAFMQDPEVGAIDVKPVHQTGSLFGASVTAGKLMGLDTDRLTSAMGYAGGMGLFLMQTHREKADGMPFNAGWACHAGVVAAMIADAGLRGPEQIFEGDRGYFQALVPNDPHDFNRLVEDLGTAWESAKGTIKLYPAGHGTHYFLNSVKSLMREGLKAEDVAGITCYIPRVRAEFHFSPKEKAYHPGPYDARFSMPFLLAAMLVDGQVGVRSFSKEKVADPRILELAQRVTYKLDEEAWLPDRRGYTVVKTKDGRTLERKTPHSQLPGTPENPAPREDILAKFRDNASFVLSPADTDKLLRKLEGLEAVGNVAEVMRLTARKV